MPKRGFHDVLFVRQQKILTDLGQRLYLAMQRRGMKKKDLCDRLGINHQTLNKVFNGDPGVAIGTYLRVMGVMGLDENFNLIAAYDPTEVKIAALVEMRDMLAI